MKADGQPQTGRNVKKDARTSSGEDECQNPKTLNTEKSQDSRNRGIQRDIPAKNRSAYAYDDL